ncbi:hypothetical protein N431DRAFT_464129 [Stipitochalara longipes BDJ]|nr:hypothetical protein N431DRAFT_464129 [Stipitochalara longipes BDJ]
MGQVGSSVFDLDAAPVKQLEFNNVDEATPPNLDINTLANQFGSLLNMDQKILPISDPGTSSISSTTIEAEPLTSFTCFLKLPPEIQCMVWKLAPYVPSLTTLNLENLHLLSKNSMSGRLDGAYAGHSRPVISKRPLPTACRTSRDCAMREYGTPYTFESRSTDPEGNESFRSTWTSAFQLYLTNSPAETFYFSCEGALDDFRCFWRIIRGGEVQHSVTHSLALGNVYARPLDNRDLSRMNDPSAVWRNKDTRVLGSMSSFWPPFPQLQALTFVDPKVINSSTWDEQKRYLGTTWISSEENIGAFVKTLEKKLGKYSADVER